MINWRGEATSPKASASSNEISDSRDVESAASSPSEPRFIDDDCHVIDRLKDPVGVFLNEDDGDDDATDGPPLPKDGVDVKDRLPTSMSPTA